MTKEEKNKIYEEIKIKYGQALLVYIKNKEPSKELIEWLVDCLDEYSCAFFEGVEDSRDSEYRSKLGE